MKRYLTFFALYLLYSGISFAHEPMMATAILKNLIKEEASPTISSHCSDMPQNIKTTESSLQNPIFKAQIQCEIKCKNAKPQTTQSTQDFDPRDLGLTAGDGSSEQKILWRSLGYTLKTWGNSICLSEAEKICQNKEEIEELALQKITSGSWEFQGELHCHHQKIVLSPYDKDQTLEKSKNSDALFSPINLFDLTPNVNQFQTLLPSNISSQKVQELFIFEGEKKTCKHPIQVNSCFGDCIWLEDPNQKEWTETLATPEFFGDLSYTLCADTYIEQIHNKNWSKAVNQNLCEKFSWEAIRASEIPGTSCAAFRVEVDCSQL